MTGHGSGVVEAIGEVVERGVVHPGPTGVLIMYLKHVKILKFDDEMEQKDGSCPRFIPKQVLRSKLVEKTLQAEVPEPVPRVKQITILNELLDGLQIGGTNTEAQPGVVKGVDKVVDVVGEVVEGVVD